MKRKALTITLGKYFDILFKISRSLFFKEVDGSPMSGDARQSGILDFTPWIPDSRYKIPIVCGIPD